MPYFPSGGLGLPIDLTGAVAATRYVGGTATGAPVSGTFAAGDFVVTQDGNVFICTVAGTPGTWTKPSAPSGGVLAVVSYNPGTTATYTITAQTLTDVDATNLVASFVAPVSTNVIVDLECTAVANSMNGTLWWAPVFDHAYGNGVAANIRQMAPGSDARTMLQHSTHYVTGLTAGTTYQVKWQAAFTTIGGNAIMYAGGTPVTATTLGPAVMIVRSA